MMRIGALSYAKMLHSIIDQPATASELAFETGLSLATVRSYLTALHRESVIHVAAWERDSIGRARTPAYLLGAGKDVKKPILTMTQKNRRYREKQAQLRTQRAIAGVAA